MGVGCGPDIVHLGVGQLFSGGQQDHAVADPQLAAAGFHCRTGTQGNEGVTGRGGLLCIQNFPACFNPVYISYPGPAFQGTGLAGSKCFPDTLRQLRSVQNFGFEGYFPGKGLLKIFHLVDPQLHAPLQHSLKGIGEHIVFL